MTRLTKALMIALLAALAAAPALAAPPEGAAAAASPTVTATEPLRIQPWHLLQQDGAELYAELCASCHGAADAGDGLRATPLRMAAPPLTHLQRAGVPREHWTYVILSGCEDHHHWAADGSETMPCWQRAFRQALRHEAAPLMVARKLTDYLESIQE